jgi:hypothetical protein
MTLTVRGQDRPVVDVVGLPSGIETFFSQFSPDQHQFVLDLLMRAWRCGYDAGKEDTTKTWQDTLRRQQERRLPRVRTPVRNQVAMQCG